MAEVFWTLWELELGGCKIYGFLRRLDVAEKVVLLVPALWRGADDPVGTHAGETGTGASLTPR